jgi:feruloyl-CoA synthase
VIVVPPDHEALGLRDPRYAPRRLTVERRADGAILLHNPSPLTGVFDNAVDALAHWARRAPERPWLAERAGEGWRRISYGEADEQARAITGGLAGVGLERGGAPLLILARNGIDHALVAFAAMSLGVPVAAISPQYGLAGADLSRLAHAVRLIAPGAVLVDDPAAFAGALGSDLLAGLPVIALRGAWPGAILLNDLLRAAPMAPLAQPDDIAKLLLTSGSTGSPKAVVCLHRGVAVAAAQVAACFDDPEPPVVVNQAPWSHSLGANAILQMVTHRGGLIHVDAGQPVAGRHLETVRNLREIAPTYHNMVPAGWDLLADELERDDALARTFFSRVRLLQYGGAALRQSTCDRVQAVARATIGEGVSFSSGYGATETGPTATNVHWPNVTMGLMGLPVPQTTVKLAPSQGRLEFRVKGPQMSAGYHRNPEATAAALDEEGFYRLGDAARAADPERLELGLVFDGRLSENFKLANGTFVNAGALRVAAISAIGGAAADAVVCGEGESGVGLLIFLGAAVRAELSPAAIRAAVAAGLKSLNAAAAGGSGRVERALILQDAPDAASGEITDKGYINQTLARTRRASQIRRLFDSGDGADVVLP